MGQEYELKYRAEASTLEAIRHAYGPFAAIAMETTYYDTPDAALSRRKWTLRRRLENGVSVVLDIEVQGAAQVKAKLPEAVTVFLAPPGLDALERRLRGRGTESEEKIRARLDTAQREMALAPSYDYTVINDDPDRAARALGDILDK